MTWATDPEGALVGHGMARARREFCTESLRQRGMGIKTDACRIHVVLGLYCFFPWEPVHVKVQCGDSEGDREVKSNEWRPYPPSMTA
jgi:hypothetical protein